MERPRGVGQRPQEPGTPDQDLKGETGETGQAGEQPQAAPPVMEFNRQSMRTAVPVAQPGMTLHELGYVPYYKTESEGVDIVIDMGADEERDPAAHGRIIKQQIPMQYAHGRKGIVRVELEAARLRMSPKELCARIEASPQFTKGIVWNPFLPENANRTPRWLKDIDPPKAMAQRESVIVPGLVTTSAGVGTPPVTRTAMGDPFNPTVHLRQG